MVDQSSVKFILFCTILKDFYLRLMYFVKLYKLGLYPTFPEYKETSSVFYYLGTTFITLNPMYVAYMYRVMKG